MLAAWSRNLALEFAHFDLDVLVPVLCYMEAAIVNDPLQRASWRSGHPLDDSGGAGFEAVDFAHAAEGAADMGNSNRTTHHERHAERVDDFFAVPTLFGGADQVIGDAIVAAQHCAGDQTEQFLGLGSERAGLVGLMVQRKEAFNAEVAAAKNLLVKLGACFLEISKAVRHGSSLKGGIGGGRVT